MWALREILRTTHLHTPRFGKLNYGNYETQLWRRFRFSCKAALKDSSDIIQLKSAQINSVKLIDQ